MSTEKFSIRKMIEKDVRKATNVIRRSLLPLLQADNVSDETIKQVFAKHNPSYLAKKAREGQFFVAETRKGKKIIGVVGLRKNDESDVFNRVSTFYIDPKYQRKGVGTALYDHIETFAKQLGVSRLVVSSRSNSESFYERLGFKKVRIEWKNYPDGRRYNVWMEKNL